MEIEGLDIRREGRTWKAGEALPRYALLPGKLELIKGRLLWSDEERLTLLALLLENVGIDQAIKLGEIETWRVAVAERMEE
jgi:hypothetical protein